MTSAIPSSTMTAPTRVSYPAKNLLQVCSHAARSVRAGTRTAIFFLKVFPMLPSRPIDWVTDQPVVERVHYPTCCGQAQGELYRPTKAGPHPGILVCLGVVPFGVDHPQVAVLGKALARAGFVALLYWSPAMRSFQLAPGDIENISLAYRWLIDQPMVDADRSGLLGTCVGGSFAIMAAAMPLIRDHVAFLSVYAPYSSMWIFVRDIASASVTNENGTRSWQVDPLTRKVFVNSITAWLEPDEAQRLRSAFENGKSEFNDANLSLDGKAVYSLLIAASAEEADEALHCLLPSMQKRLHMMSPIHYLKDLHAPLINILHDIGDPVIPVDESRRLHAALFDRAEVGYTEMRFQHLDPVKGKLPLFRLLRELGKFFLAVYPLFRQTTA